MAPTSSKAKAGAKATTVAATPKKRVASRSVATAVGSAKKHRSKILDHQDTKKDVGPLPVVLVTGFLGAGKTTLVNHALRHRGDLSAAVFVNEYGAVDVDGAMLRWQGGIQRDQVLTLKNGCICCGGKDDIAIVVSQDLRAVRDELDVLVVETSGITNPYPVLESLATAEGLFVASVVCVVDATTIEDGDFGRGADAGAQIGAADVLVLSKADLLSADALDAAERTLLALRATAAPDAPRPQFQRAEHGAIDLASVCGLTKRGEASKAPATARLPPLAGASDKHDDYANHCFIAPRAFDRARFEAWAASPPPGLLRAKGVLWIAGESKPMVWHLAGGRASTLQAVDEADTPLGSELVFIGRYGCGWCPAEIDRGLAECLAP